MHYILTPSPNGVFWYADQYAYYERRTPAEKQNIQSRWDARKLRHQIAKHLSPLNCQSAKRM